MDISFLEMGKLFISPMKGMGGSMDSGILPRKHFSLLRMMRRIWFSALAKTERKNAEKTLVALPVLYRLGVQSVKE